MLFLLTIFMPPVAILLCGKVFQALFNAVIYGIAIICLVPAMFGLVFLFIPGLLFAGTACWHASNVVKESKANKRNRDLIEAIHHANGGR